MLIRLVGDTPSITWRLTASLLDAMRGNHDRDINYYSTLQFADVIL